MPGCVLAVTGIDVCFVNPSVRLCKRDRVPQCNSLSYQHELHPGDGRPILEVPDPASLTATGVCCG